MFVMKPLRVKSLFGLVLAIFLHFRNINADEERLWGRKLIPFDVGGTIEPFLVEKSPSPAEAPTSGYFQPGFFHALATSFSMIVATELGDQTFIIAALMGMRHSRIVVFSGAVGALTLMTVLSTGLGLLVPKLISKDATNKAAIILYTFFGLKLLYTAWTMEPEESTQKELEELEERLEERDHEREEDKKKANREMRRVLSRFFTPIFLEAFVLIFLAEWGDRSQIATITMASYMNPVGVTLGAVAGHFLCTALAVVGGRLLALKISPRIVAFAGGVLFLVFAFNAFLFPPNPVTN